MSKQVAWVLLLLLAGGCYEKQEGCLDVLAENFDLEADVDCCPGPDNCCCEYPKVTWRIKHEYRDENLTAGKTLLTNSGQPFQIEYIRFFLSNFRLIDHGTAYAVNDSISMRGQSGQEILRPDDVKIVNLSTFSLDFEVFNRTGTYMTMDFTVGLTEPELNADRTSFESSHPLASDQKELRDTINNEWWMYDMAWIPDTSTKLVQYIHRPSTDAIAISLPIDLVKNPGESLSISIAIDYTVWLQDIDIEHDDQDTINDKLLAGLAKSFSIL
ncbi:MAG: hypothetical protein KDC53_02105 [Saprospiraceae bacterium]|nr:hypothetical protein [Saprospiraceae bacterium]